jgi:glyoxylase I family protein
VIRGLDHVGIVVADLAAAEQFLTETLGLVAGQRLSLPAQDTEVVFYDCGGVQLELVEVRDPDLRAKRLGPEGTTARIEHLALRVEGLDDVAKVLRERGVALTAGAASSAETTEPLEVEGTRSLFTRRDSATGLLVQLIERLDA